MATLERISYSPQTITVTETSVDYKPSRRKAIKKLPQIFWKDASPWREANQWALDRVTGADKTLRTIASNLNNLLHYANFLEKHDLTWFTFPIRKADRCLVRYRGWLIEQRDAKLVAPSTASEYMRNVIAFYRWLLTRGLLDADLPLWRDRVTYIRFFDEVGFERTAVRTSTDLSIPNRSNPKSKLEDGLLPITARDRDILLDFCHENSTPELYRMLSLGFFTGMRIGSICDLKIQSLKNAIPDPQAPGLYRLSLGPGASPAVHTKFDVTGQVWIPKALLDELLDYSASIRRSQRQALAAVEERDILFLTSHGNPYSRRNDHSTAINTEMSRLRTLARKADIKVLTSFKFHQSRCTFATEVASIALRAGDPINVIAIVKDALLHRNEATSMKYIKFIEDTPIKMEVSNEFMRIFSGRKNA